MQKVPRKKIASPTCAIAAFVVEYAYVAIDKAALVGEPAVPCNLQSATAGMNSRLRICSVSSDPGKQR